MPKIEKLLLNLCFNLLGEESYESYKKKCQLLKQIEHQYNLVVGNRKDGFQLPGEKRKWIVVRRTELKTMASDVSRYCDFLDTDQIHRLAEWNDFIDLIVKEYDQRGIDKCVNSTILPGDVYWIKAGKECDNIKILINELKNSITIAKGKMIFFLLIGGIVIFGCKEFM